MVAVRLKVCPLLFGPCGPLKPPALAGGAPPLHTASADDRYVV